MVLKWIHVKQYVQKYEQVQYIMFMSFTWLPA